MGLKRSHYASSFKNSNGLPWNMAFTLCTFGWVNIHLLTSKKLISILDSKLLLTLVGKKEDERFYCYKKSAIARSPVR